MGERAPKSVRPRIHPFLRRSICSRSEKQREEDAFKEALGVMSEDGDSRQSAEANRVLGEITESNTTGRDPVCAASEREDPIWRTGGRPSLLTNTRPHA